MRRAMAGTLLPGRMSRTELILGRSMSVLPFVGFELDHSRYNPATEVLSGVDSIHFSNKRNLHKAALL
jgi:hypothetical protein